MDKLSSLDVLKRNKMGRLEDRMELHAQSFIRVMKIYSNEFIKGQGSVDVQKTLEEMEAHLDMTVKAIGRIAQFEQFPHLVKNTAQ